MSTYLQRLLEIKQAWESFNQHATAQKIQRSNDIQSLLNTLEKKITMNQLSQNSKIEIFDQELSKIAQDITDIKSSLSKSYENQQKILQLSKVKTQQRCCQTYQNIKNTGKAILKRNLQQGQKLKQQIQKQNKKQMADLSKKVSQLTQIKQFIQKKLLSCHKSHKQSLDQLTQNVENQLKQMQQYLQQKKIYKAQKQQKLKYMVDALVLELDNCIQRQQQFGKLNYDCQLKLIQDFHTYIKGKSTLL